MAVLSQEDHRESGLVVDDVVGQKLRYLPSLMFFWGKELASENDVKRIGSATIRLMLAAISKWHFTYSAAKLSAVYAIRHGIDKPDDILPIYDVSTTSLEPQPGPGPELFVKRI